MRASTKRQPWWRKRWLGLAILVALLQFAAFWLASPDVPNVHPTRQPPRNTFLPADERDSAQEEWLWLMHSGLFLSSSTRDFSGLAWLSEIPLRVPLADLAARNQPLPYSAVANWSPPPLLARIDPTPANGWRPPAAGIALPKASPVPMGTTTVAMILEGLEGWDLLKDPQAPPSPPGPPGALSATVLRIAVDARGHVAVPPLVWQSSGSAAADEAAAEYAAGLQLHRQTSDSPDESESADLDWGLVAIEWPVATPPVTNLTTLSP